MKANVFHGRMRIWWFLICFTLTFIYFEGDAYGSPPAISIITPLDEDTASAPYMDMEISVSADTYPLTFWLYGDTVSAPAELLYVQEGITGPTTIPITWDALTLRPEASTVGLWHFDDNFGITTADISSYGNDGTMINGAQWTDDGRFGYAVAFDGTDDYISIPDLDNSLDVDPTTGALTIEAWINPNAIGGNTYRGFISKRDSALATQVNYSLYLNNTNGALSFYNGTFPAGFYVSSVIPSLNTWTYIAVTLDATESTLRFYRNGELEDAITGTTFGPAHDGRLTIGTSQTPTGNRCFSGMIDEVRITTRQLSDDDIAANYGLRRDYYSWSATATDAGMESSATAEQHFTIGLMMMPLSDGSVPEGGTLVVDVTAANPDDATINLTMSALDNGTFVDHGDGTGTLTFMPDYDQAGDHSVTFYADDGLESVARTINIAVTNTNRPPDVTDIPDQSTEEGGSYPMLELSGCCNDPDVPIDDAIEWTSTDGTNLDISITGCEVTVTILDENWHGQETITFRATDLGGLYDEDDVTFMVTGVNDAPLVDDILDNDIVICNEITLAVSGSDIDGIVSEVSASASPSGSLPEGASFTDYGDGTGLFVWTPTPDQPGIYPLRFTVVDDSGATAYDDVTVTVNDDIAPPAVTLIAPSNGYTTSDQTMDLSTTLSDDGPLTVLVYGGRDPDEMILLDISENITDNTFTYNWIHPLMLPDPVTTMGLWRLDEFTGYFTYDDGKF